MNHTDSVFFKTAGGIRVTLDGETVNLPRERHSLNSIRGYLELRTLARQRVLSAFSVDGQPANLALPLVETGEFCQIDAESIPLGELPRLLLNTAQQQADRARESVEAALTLVLINNSATARELWWDIARQLKEPVLTLSLMPPNVCRLCGGVSFDRLRRWQLEQIAVIVCEVDSVCETGDTIRISDAIENRVLPWLQQINEQIALWLETISAGYELGINYNAA